MSQEKSIESIASEVGEFPFSVYSDSRECLFHVTAVSPDRMALGWHLNGANKDRADLLPSGNEIWRLVKKRREFLEILYEEDGLLTSGWFESEADLKKYKVNVIKILRREVVEE